MPILPFDGITPTIAEDCFIAPNATIIGAVTIGAGSSVWYNTVLRGDLGPITIGQRTSVQDGCVIHADTGHPTTIGDNVTIGHGAILHGCTVGRGCLIGMRSTILNDVVVGEFSTVGAGAVVSGKVIPPRSLVLGIPARILRQVTDDEVATVVRGEKEYAILSQKYLSIYEGEAVLCDK